MYGLKAQTVASSKVTSKSAMPSLGVLPAQRRRHIRPFFFHIGPVALCIVCVLLISLMAVLYLSQVGQVVTANHQLQNIRNEQAALERQNQDLVDTVAQEQSPAYIVGQVQKMGLEPVDAKNLWVLQVPHLQEVDKSNQSIQP
jgi:hypothetical protein